MADCATGEREVGVSENRDDTDAVDTVDVWNDLGVIVSRGVSICGEDIILFAWSSPNSHP
jgi:hypothetical protein